MRSVALVAATTLSLAASYFVGVRYSQVRDSYQHNLCLTDRTLVSQLEQNLAETTRADLARFGIPKKRWERIRGQTIDTMYAFQEAAPCTVNVRIPPDVF